MKYFLGIDQTGAINKLGVPRPLASCYICSNSKVHFFYLNELSKKPIFDQINLHDTDEILIAVDCVFGLPQELKLNWDEVVTLIHQCPNYGQKQAQNFFFKLSNGIILKRQIEIILKAQSVFQEKPFQKNIQTGTFRLWKDYAQNRADFYISAIEFRKNPKQIALYEGYPTLAWKILFNCKKREPLRLSQLLKNSKFGVQISSDQQSLINKDPNFADAFVLALLLQTQDPFNDLPVKPTPEGHILGYKTGREYPRLVEHQGFVVLEKSRSIGKGRPLI